ncbi:MAG: putative soluble lytic transglycosylase fused to an ABC-type amino acid-binding protein [Proteobacteria bacterium]|nr:putative soluble lytic transglycosylase fused to an ABC-type amino acid-binding protein [Pseudomonadota bacterium]
MRFLLFILSIFVASCGENIEQPIAKANELVILTRVGASTYSEDTGDGASGFDYDLARRLADELGLKSRIVVAASDADILHRLKNGEAHLAAAWQTPVDDPQLRSSTPYFESHNVLVTHEASLPLASIAQLANKVVHVVAGSRQEMALREIQRKGSSLIIVASEQHNELDLLEGVAAQRYEAALVNDAQFDIGSNYYPDLQNALVIGPARPIVWLFAPGVDPALVTKANAFLDKFQQSGEMDRLKDRYFGHVERLTQADSVRFIERMRSVLPQYRALFYAAQVNTGIDWRLLAALAYQESQWEPRATSPTGVRGMMMLTAETADTLGISNRLDATQSVEAGAQYVSDLRDALPAIIGDPDRLWLALAAYNVGMGHLNAARYLATTLGTDPDSWYAMKKVLPLLAQPQYYRRLKSGKGRGGEAVIMVENIRVYNDILKRHERPYRPLAGIQTAPELSPYPLLPSADNDPPSSRHKPRAAKPSKKAHLARRSPAK